MKQLILRPRRIVATGDLISCMAITTQSYEVFVAIYKKVLNISDFRHWLFTKRHIALENHSITSFSNSEP